MKRSSWHTQIAALPIRLQNGRTEALLVQTRSGRWTPPKGWPVPGLPDHQAAAREAFEEAGVSGAINDTPLGWMSYNKTLRSGLRVECRATVFSLDVRHVARNWPEKNRRRRKWVSLDAALASVGVTPFA